MKQYRNIKYPTCVGILMSVLLHFSSPVFAQNTLSYFVEQAKQNSPLIQDNKNQNEAAKLEIERIKAFYTKPQITLTGTLAVSPIINQDNGKSELNISPTDANKYYGYDIAASNGGIYQGLVNVNQNLFAASKYQTASQQALIGAKINQNNIQLSSHDLEKFVTDQYILCLQDLKQIEYIKGLIQLLTEQKNISLKLVESGLLKQSDLLLVKIEYETQQNAANTFQATYRRDLMDLNVICGINDTGYQTLQDLSLTINQVIVNDSKYTERFRLDSLNLIAAQRTFELKYKPQLNAFANAGLNGVYVPTLPNRFGASAGVNFTMFIFDGRQKNLNQQKTNLLVKSTQAYKSNFIAQNTIRKNKFLNEIQSLDERMMISSNQLNEYKQLLDYYRKELAIGQQSIVTYINTVKSIAILQRDYVLMQTTKQLLINNYNYWNW